MFHVTDNIKNAKHNYSTLCSTKGGIQLFHYQNQNFTREKQSSNLITGSGGKKNKPCPCKRVQSKREQRQPKTPGIKTTSPISPNTTRWLLSSAQKAPPPHPAEKRRRDRPSISHSPHYHHRVGLCRKYPEPPPLSDHHHYRNTSSENEKEKLIYQAHKKGFLVFGL